MNRITDGISYVDLLIVIVLVGTFKILFFFTGFILEDSFIVFRSSFNLADFGSFSYNLGELNSATSDTFLIAWLITGEINWAGAIAGIEVFTKIILYYAHERAWYRYSKLGVIDK